MPRRAGLAIDIDIKLPALRICITATEQLLLRLPDDLVRRFKQAVPAHERSAFVRHLLEQALPAVDGDHDPLYLTALAVEQDASLNDEMAEWDAIVGDGLTDTPATNRPG